MDEKDKKKIFLIGRRYYEKLWKDIVSFAEGTFRISGVFISYDHTSEFRPRTCYKCFKPIGVYIDMRKQTKNGVEINAYHPKCMESLVEAHPILAQNPENC